jgi:hypothetical protein
MNQKSSLRETVRNVSRVLTGDILELSRRVPLRGRSAMSANRLGP